MSQHQITEQNLSRLNPLQPSQQQQNLELGQVPLHQQQAILGKVLRGELLDDADAAKDLQVLQQMQSFMNKMGGVPNGNGFDQLIEDDAPMKDASQTAQQIHAMRRFEARAGIAGGSREPVLFNQSQLQHMVDSNAQITQKEKETNQRYEQMRATNGMGGQPYGPVPSQQQMAPPMVNADNQITEPPLPKAKFLDSRFDAKGNPNQLSWQNMNQLFITRPRQFVKQLEAYQNEFGISSQQNTFLAQNVDGEPIAKFKEKTLKMIDKEVQRLSYVNQINQIYNKDGLNAQVQQDQVPNQLQTINKFYEYLRNREKDSIQSGPVIDRLVKTQELINKKQIGKQNLQQRQPTSMFNNFFGGQRQQTNQQSLMKQNFSSDLNLLKQSFLQDIRSEFAKIEKQLQDPDQMMEHLYQRRRENIKKNEDKQMNRGTWEPVLEKEQFYLPSNWIGDFDFNEVYHDRNIEFMDQDLYYRVYKDSVNDPVTVYDRLNEQIMKNKERMTRANIPIRPGQGKKGPRRDRIVVHEKITIQVVHGDILDDSDKSHIKCCPINYNVLPESSGISHMFERIGGNKIKLELGEMLSVRKSMYGMDAHFEIGGMAITNPHNIRHARKLFFLCGPEFKYTKIEKKDREYRYTIMNALQASIFVKPVCHSISIPGISLGKRFKYPPRRAAKLMLEMCVNWATLVQTNGIRHIKIINRELNEHKAFILEMSLIQQNLDQYPKFEDLSPEYGITDSVGKQFNSFWVNYKKDEESDSSDEMNK